jgi:hypothetical protein
VRDHQTGQDVVLSEADVDIIQRLQAQKIPDANFDDVAVSVFNIVNTAISLFATVGYYLQNITIILH